MSGTNLRDDGPTLPGRLGRRRVASLVGAVALVPALLAGCSGDDGSKDGEGGSGDSGLGADQPVATDARIGAVRGTIDDATSTRTVDAVSAVVDGWIDGAYGGDYPREDFAPAFADFTKDARALALKQPTVMSNAALGPSLDDVEITVRTVLVDVLAPQGKVAASTARVRLVMTTHGDHEGSEVVTGRLMLTPGADGWRVFGFNVNRGQEGA